MLGICIDYAGILRRGIWLESAANVHGICIAYVWNMQGTRMAHAWVMHGM